ncbi:MULTISPECIES: hypothetical protein [unclassified Polaromonas]|uniref:hypothetical protein n=1 Tax=unclassified Polaromonas TaxID=2638319 RepID=UPI00129E4CA3|nr:MULTISPECIES: hypothetical protein [unclassified Polaromonas]QGJ20112.1 hypothetical protein F7R28_18110 [Polaromonas sp. Pch-P]
MTDPFLVNRPFLTDVCPAFARAVANGCRVIGRSDLAEEIVRVVLPPQLIAGAPDSYSFLAYPVPRLTLEQRQLLEVRDFERIQVPVGAGTVSLELDVFGKIGWFYVDMLSEHYEAVASGAQQHAL